MTAPLRDVVPEELRMHIEARSDKDLEDLQAWVRQARTVGLDPASLKDTLIGSGWPAPFVEWYLAASVVVVEEAPKPEPSKQAEYVWSAPDNDNSLLDPKSATAARKPAAAAKPSAPTPKPAATNQGGGCNFIWPIIAFALMRNACDDKSNSSSSSSDSTSSYQSTSR